MQPMTTWTTLEQRDNGKRKQKMEIQEKINIPTNQYGITNDVILILGKRNGNVLSSRSTTRMKEKSSLNLIQPLRCKVNHQYDNTWMWGQIKLNQEERQISNLFHEFLIDLDSYHQNDIYQSSVVFK